MKLSYRIALILALVALSVWMLVPRTVKERRLVNGASTVVEVKRVPIKKGLDLQGGMHVALEVDESKGTVANKSDAIDRALKVVRNRVDQFGVSEPVVQKAGNDRIVVELPGIDDPDRARDLLQKSAYLEFQITDKTDALVRSLPRLDAVAKQIAPTLGTAKGATAEAAAGPGVTTTDKALTGLFGGDTSKKSATAAQDSAPADSLALGGQGIFSRNIQRGEMPGEYYVASSAYDQIAALVARPEIQAALPARKVFRWSNDSLSIQGTTYRLLYVLDAEPMITGEAITDAKPQQDPTEGTVVTFTLSNEGGRVFKRQTSAHIKDYMAIVLDQLVMGRPPIIQGAISTRGQITMGRRDLQAAQDLALVLRAGALPVPLKVAEVRQVGASMGKDSVRKGMMAGLLAVALVVIIMLVYYRFSGFLAVIGLALYVLYTMATLSGFDAVLTLPGLAGFVLSIGIAVDANVLIFERIREELDRGKTVRTAIDEGFRHAMPAIVDSNVSTMLTAAVLYQWGSGPVRGFAVTLIAGIAASMFTAIFVVRTLFLLWLQRKQGAAQTVSI
ncbi:MAG TPA: protein translocase subunit SecD [Gemmatimonadaceae bacterium]|nr:protein translocase subunit SecD [Gemmatimonadaceae bacterium]